MAGIPLTAPIVDAGATPVYLSIAGKAAHLRELGMSDRAVARAIGVSDKTVAKSLRLGSADGVPASSQGGSDTETHGTPTSATC